MQVCREDSNEICTLMHINRTDQQNQSHAEELSEWDCRWCRQFSVHLHKHTRCRSYFVCASYSKKSKDMVVCYKRAFTMTTAGILSQGTTRVKEPQIDLERECNISIHSHYC